MRRPASPVLVEKRSWGELVPHGVAAGLCGGIALGLAQFLISAARQEGALTPFRLVASLVVGPEALEPGTSTALVMAIGGALHLFLAALFGVVFVVLLALAFQLAARSPALVSYGLLFGFLLWEVNFLAVLPAFYPDLTARVGLESQIWKGIAAYTFVYGPVLGLYVAAARPGVLSEWVDRAADQTADRAADQAADRAAE